MRMDVDIWSDIACPWCSIGKRRFETALAGWEHRDEVVVTWHAFELDPTAPPERHGDRTEGLARKYGITIEQARAAQDHITREAAGEGLEFRFDIARSGNTFDAHRLVALGAQHGLQGETKERLMAAYLCEGELISDHETLARLGTEVGLPAGEIAELLAGDRFADEVRTDEGTASALGIRAVPFFVADRAVGASGAHPPEMLTRLLDTAYASARARRGASASPGR
jgi:predicted DsbA family dithiol-disulfide isomerase